MDKKAVTEMRYELLTLAPRRSILLCGTNFYAVPDMHPDRTLVEHDLLYVAEGEWSLCQDDTHYVVHKDEAMLLRAGSHHYSVKPCAPNTRTLFVYFTANENDRSEVELPVEKLSDYCAGEMVCLPTVVDCSHHGSVIRMMQKMMELYWTDRSDKHRQMSIQLELLLCELAYVYREQHAKGEEWLPRVLEQLRLNPSRMYSVQELAQIASMSTRNFSTIFKRATGQSVHQYQLNLKLELAFTTVRSEPGARCRILPRTLAFTMRTISAGYSKTGTAFRPSIFAGASARRSRARVALSRASACFHARRCRNRSGIARAGSTHPPRCH